MSKFLSDTDVASANDLIKWDGSAVARVPIGSAGTALKVNGAGNTAFNDSSDERLKENITDVDDGYLELINDIRIRNFDWIDRPNSMKKVGVIAQELEKVIPNVVSKGGDNPNKQPYQVSYPTLVPYLIKAVQELSAKVKELEKKCEDCC